LAEQLGQAVSKVTGIRKVLRTRVRNVGNQVFVDFSVEVPRYMSLEESHAVTREAQNAVQTISRGADVVVTTVPVGENEGVLEKIHAVAAREHLSIHNVSMYWTEKGIWADLDLEVDPTLSLERAHEVANALESRLRVELNSGEYIAPIANVTVHIEPLSEEFVLGSDLEAAEHSHLTARIEALARELPHCYGCKGIELHKVRGRVYLSLELLIDGDRAISDVHDIAEDMETRLRGEFHQLGRVVIHTTPQS
jgi:divalent metal cation (Fe/Co/Zn/Cd) transporter